jgi:hypothetical protein
MHPAIPLFLLWIFIGLPSLACAIITVRLARTADRLGIVTKVAFHLILLICTLVPLLASFAAWTAGTGGFPWLVWLVSLLVSTSLWYLALRLRIRPWNLITAAACHPGAVTPFRGTHVPPLPLHLQEAL